MAEEHKKTEPKVVTGEFEKKSYTYPEAPQTQARPAGALVPQPSLKQNKKCE